MRLFYVGKAGIDAIGAHKDCVRSSGIDAIGYDRETRTLYVLYQGNKLYSHARVPVETGEQWHQVESIGAWVNREIKPNFPGTEILTITQPALREEEAPESPVSEHFR